MKKKLLDKIVFFIYLLLLVSIATPIYHGQSPIKLGLDLSGGVIVSYRPDFSRVTGTVSDMNKQEILATTKEIIITRLQRKLKTVPDVYITDNNRITVSIPSVKGKEEILDIVGRTYHLTEQLVLNTYDDSISRKKLHYYRGQYYELDSAYFTGNMLDEGSIKVIMPDPKSLNRNDRYPKVQVAYKPPYDREYAEFTGRNIGKSIAILIDGEIELVATINSKIYGAGVLTGKYTLEEARNNVNLLKSGSLPVSLEIESLSEIGPTLGQEVKEKGLLAALLSILLLIALIIISYSNRIWLMLNGVLSLLFLLFTTALFVAAFNLTIDFAAIAGFILALSMGMDAFIIIFESLVPKLKRARTELQLMAHFDIVVQEIYSLKREGRVLFHSMVSTLLVISLILFTDRIKFFALAMVAGLGASFLTILFTRKMLSLTRNLAQHSGFSIVSWFRGVKTSIFKFRKAYLVITSIAVSFTLFLLVASLTGKPYLKLGGDFHAGTRIVVLCEKKSDIEGFISSFHNEYPEIGIRNQELKSRQKTAKYLITINKPISFPKDSTNQGYNTAKNEVIQEFGEVGQKEKIGANVNDTKKTLSLKAITKLVADNDLEVLSINAIDNKLSSSRFFSSMSVLILSFFFLAIYLFGLQKPIDNFFMRDEEELEVKTHSHGWSSVGVFLALIHDISFMLIACFLFSIEIDLIVIAAMVTIIGYSVNDSIVLLSQIQSRANRSRLLVDPVQIISKSIDGILSRSLLTSISTIIPVIAILVLDLSELKPFAIMIVVGTLFGTLSSIFIVGVFAIKTLSGKKIPQIVQTESTPEPINKEAVIGGVFNDED